LISTVLILSKSNSSFSSFSSESLLLPFEPSSSTVASAEEASVLTFSVEAARAAYA
jgi:hypothetical protein